MKPDRIILTSRMNTAELTRALDNRGVLRVDEKSGYEKNGVKFVFLRERTLLEAVQDFFTFDSGVRTKPALDALGALQSVMEDKRNAGQLLQNIQDRIEHKGSFSGRSIVRDLDKGNRSVSGKIMPLQGGTVVAESMGHGVHILQKNPLQVKANFTIVRTSALPQNLQGTYEETETSVSLAQPQGMVADNLIILDDTPLLADQEWGAHAATFQENLKNTLMFAAQTGGAIVIEVSSAMFGTGEESVSDRRQQEIISIVIRQINDSLEEAGKQQKQMAVTFAGEDLSLLSLLKSFYEADHSGLNKVNKIELSDQEDLSESDDDDNEPLVLDKNQAQLRAREMEALEQFNKIFSSKDDEGKKSG